MATALLFAALLSQLPTLPSDAIAGGRHWRIDTPQGGVHVWQPDNLALDRCGTVIYVHGYFSDVDEVWRDHGLAAQFSQSQVQARFIVPEVPQNKRQPERWPQLAPLLAIVDASLGALCRSGPHVAIGHSGGYRTIASWLDEGVLGDVVLLDALYGRERLYAAWIAAGQPHRLLLVAHLTQRRCERFVAARRDVLRRRDLVPPTTEAERSARLIYFADRYGHLELVTDGVAIPILLAWTALEPGRAP